MTADIVERLDNANYHNAPSRCMEAAREIERLREVLQRSSEQAAHGWQPIETAPKDGTWIIGICNDHSRLWRMSWGRARDDRMGWCTMDSVVTFGDGLFSPNGGWTPCPASVSGSTEGGRNV